MRHAAAVRRGALGVPDHDRPLTVRGKAKFGVAAAGLARIAGRPDVLLTSARLRARGTAEIAARAFKDIQPTIEPALATQRRGGWTTHTDSLIVFASHRLD